MTGRTCSDCPAPISRQSKGRCKSCSAKWLNRDPDASARRAAGQAAYFARPEVRASLVERANLLSHDPAHAEARRLNGIRTAATVLARPDVRAASNSPEAKRKAGRARTETIMGWCPAAYRPAYFHLVRSQRLPSAEARRMIEEQIAVDEKARLAAMTPVERQLERLRAPGAQLVERFVPPARVHSFTLGGVAPEVL